MASGEHPDRALRASSKAFPEIVSHATRERAELSVAELWVRCFELGSMSNEAEIERSLREGSFSDPREQSVVVQALRERRLELAQVDETGVAAALLRHPSSGPFAPPAVQLDLLGSFRLRRGELVRLPMNAQRLVAFLALADGFLLRRHVAGSLWGDSTDRQAAGSLRSALWRLRELSSTVIEIADSHMRLLPSVQVDLAESEALARAVLAGEADVSGGSVDIGLLSRDLLPDWTEDWILPHHDQHLQLRVRALESLSRRLSDLGDSGRAVHAAMLAVAAEPLRESAHRALIVAYLSEGDLAAASKHYDAVRRLMWDELGVDLSAETRALLIGRRRDDVADRR